MTIPSPTKWIILILYFPISELQIPRTIWKVKTGIIFYYVPLKSPFLMLTVNRIF